VMVLKGPDLQQRLYGTPAAYPSGDVDLLVPRRLAPRARALLVHDGWRFEQQGFLWRLSAAASYVRKGLRIDLHWGLHAAHLPAVVFRRLEREMWRGASVGPSGMLEPDSEALAVFLAVHAAGHPDGRPDWGDSARIAVRQARNRPRLRAVSRASGVETAVRAVFVNRRPPDCLLDGPLGRLIWWSTWLVRGQFLSEDIRDRFRSLDARLHNRGPSKRDSLVEFGDLVLSVPEGVFPPNSATLEVLRIAMPLIEDIATPAIVDVGTGSGALALSFAHALPNGRVLGLDVDPLAVDCASRNAHRLGLERVSFYQSDLLQGLPRDWGPVDVIVSNLPYVPGIVAASQRWNAPMTAIQGRDIDGLGHLRELIGQAKARLRPGGHLVMQFVDWQWESWSLELRGQGFTPRPPLTRRPGHAVVAAATWLGEP
jgi:release factor glutamine methyltransferase